MAEVVSTILLHDFANLFLGQVCHEEQGCMAQHAETSCTAYQEAEAERGLEALQQEEERQVVALSRCTTWSQRHGVQ